MEWWEATSRFFSFADSNVRTVALGSVLLGSLGGFIGVYSVLKKRSLIGDTIGHAALPGVCLAFMITGDKSPISLLIGAVITGLVSVWVISKLQFFPRIKQDAALGLTLSVFFGVGILLLTHIQRSGSGNQSGLDKFLFGQSAGMVEADVMWIAILTFFTLTISFFFYKEFLLVTFDRNFAGSIGWNSNLIDLGILTLTVITIAISLQAVGVVLTSAMLILPAVTARFWTNKFYYLLPISAIIGAVSGFLGTFGSFMFKKVPSGPLIVIAASLLFTISLLFAPIRGIIPKIWNQRNNQKWIASEHLLRAIWEINENHNQIITNPIHSGEIENHRHWKPRELKSAVKFSIQHHWIQKERSDIYLTENGYHKAHNLIRFHRLLENYLIQTAQFNVHHIDSESDEMEHFLPAEVLQELEKQASKDEIPVSPHPTKVNR